MQLHDEIWNQGQVKDDEISSAWKTKLTCQFQTPLYLHNMSINFNLNKKHL